MPYDLPLLIPGVFKPYVLRFKDIKGKLYPRPDLGSYVDGGLIKNFAIDAFDDNKYQQDKREWGGKANRKTLGISLKLKVEKEGVPQTMNALSLTKKLISTYYHAEEIFRNEHLYNQDRMISIPISGVGLLDFGISQEKQTEIIKSGEQSVDNFFQPH